MATWTMAAEDELSVKGIGSEVSILLKGERCAGVVTASKGLLVKVEYQKSESVRGTTWVPTKEVSARSSVAGGAAAAAEPPSSGGSTPPRIQGASSDVAESVLTKQKHMDSVRGSIAVAKSQDYISGANYMQNALSVVVVGASGDLAKKKTYPALLDLFAHGHLPQHVNVVGIARSVRAKPRPCLLCTSCLPTPEGNEHSHAALLKRRR